MADHEHADYLEELCRAAGEVAQTIPCMPTTRLLVVSSEPCGCNCVGATGFANPSDLVRHLLQLAAQISRENSLETPDQGGDVARGAAG